MERRTAGNQSLGVAVKGACDSDPGLIGEPLFIVASKVWLRVFTAWRGNRADGNPAYFSLSAHVGEELSLSAPRGDSDS